MSRYELSRNRAYRKGYKWAVVQAPFLGCPPRVVYFPTLIEAMEVISWYVWHERKRKINNMTPFCELYNTDYPKQKNMCWTRNMTCVESPDFEPMYSLVFFGERR